MFLIALALGAAALAAPPPATGSARIHHVARSKSRRHRRIARTGVLPLRITLLPAACRGTGCGDLDSPYRLDAVNKAPDDAKRRALKGQWRDCGITGAPVCPHKGFPILRTSD